MKQSGITQVIDLRNTSFLKRPLEKLFCRLFGIKYLNYKYPFRLNYLPEHSFFDRINKSIDEHQGITYIHCEYGKRRTGICVAIYEKLFLKKDKASVLDELYKLGFQEILNKKTSKKAIKLKNIVNDFLHRYYPNEQLA